jgi:hypothetical protein
VAYIGNQPTTTAFLTDTFSANGSGTVFTLSAAPANTNSIIVAVSGVLQDPSTYSVSGTALTFSAAPPAGTGNISVRFLGIPASGIVNTAYRTQTEFTATAGQTTFSVPSYTVGFIDVYRNGALLGSADFTATNGTTVVLAAGASAGDLVETVSFYVSSVLNAIPATNGAVTNAYLLDGSITKAKMGSGSTWAPVGTVIQVVNATYSTQVGPVTTTYTDTGISASITPTSSSSKVLVLVSQQITAAGGGLDSGGQLRIVRGASEIFATSTTGVYIYNPTSGSEIKLYLSLNYLDSPATTSSTTYKMQGRDTSYGSSLYFQDNGSTTSITLMEIAA